MKIEPNCIYESYELSGHARHRYIYTWINENGKLVANNTYHHGDFKKTFDSYEYSYDIKKLEEMQE